MSCFNFFPQAPLIGLDIQSNAIRLMQLKKKRECYVERMIERTLPENIFTEGKIMHWEVLQSNLTELVREQRLNGMAAAICLPANLVRMQRISLPIGLNDVEIETEIRLHLQRDFPGMTDALCTDFTILTQNKHEAQIFFVTMREEYLLQYTECVKSAGLQIKVIDVDVCAIRRAVSSVLPPLIPQELYALVYLLNQNAVLIGFDAQAILFHQYWDMTETDDLSMQLNHYLQLNISANPLAENTKLFVYGVNKHSLMLDNEKMSIHYIDPFEKIKFTRNNKHPDVLSNYLLAYGLAMRRRFAW